MQYRYLALLLVLGACDGEFKETEFVIHDIKSGPGLISGEDGEFIIYKGDPFGSEARD